MVCARSTEIFLIMEIKDTKLHKREIIVLTCGVVLMFAPQALALLFPTNILFIGLSDYPGWFVYLIILFIIMQVLARLFEKDKPMGG